MLDVLNSMTREVHKTVTAKCILLALISPGYRSMWESPIAGSQQTHIYALGVLYFKYSSLLIAQLYKLEQLRIT